MKRKIISTLLVVSMLLTVCASILIGAEAKAELPFTDVEKWAKPYVQTVFEKGIMVGTSDTKFGSKANFTREQMVRTLYMMSGEKVETSKSALEAIFADGGKIASWAREAVAWAYENKITSGTLVGSKLYFYPQNPVTREQAAKFAVSYLKHTGCSTEGSIVKEIKDINKVAKWAREDVDACVKLGIISGDNNGYFNPQGYLLREQAAVILAKMSEIKPTVTPEGPKEPVVNKDPYDPNPTNIGEIDYGDAIVAAGLQISDAVLVDDAAAGNQFTATGLGNHGWVESRIVRNENGTYIIMTTDESIRKTGTYSANGKTYNYALAECTFYILKATSKGYEKVYEGTYDAPHGGSCAPNLLSGEDGKIYVAVFTVHGETYFDSNLARAAACLDVHEFDTNTNKIVSHTRDIIPFNEGPYYNQGYYQPCIDVKQGKIYAMFAAGGNNYPNYEGYVSWFIYDIKSQKWESTNYLAKTPELVARPAYMHIYPDGNGGVYFLVERDMHPRDLEQHYAKYGYTDIKFGTNSYIWDAVFLLRIPNMHEANIVKVDDIFVPAYTNKNKFPRDDQGQINPSGASHYAGGTSYLDSKGRLHVVCQIEGSPYSYSVYDVNDNFKRLKRANLGLMNSGSYQFAMTENTSGDVFLVAISTGTRTTIEVYEVDITAQNPTSKSTSLIKTANGEKASVELTYADGSSVSHGRLAYTGTRNLSIQDNTICFVTSSGTAERKTSMYKVDMTLYSGENGHCDWSGVADTHEWTMYSIKLPE